MSMPGWMQTRLQRAGQRYLVDRCDILRETETVSPAGYITLQTTVIAAEVPCRVLPDAKKDTDIAAGMQEVRRGTFEIVLPVDTDLQAKDLVRIAMVEHEVFEIRRPISDAVFLQARIVRVQA